MPYLILIYIRRPAPLLLLGLPLPLREHLDIDLPSLPYRLLNLELCVQPRNFTLELS